MGGKSLFWGTTVLDLFGLKLRGYYVFFFFKYDSVVYPTDFFTYTLVSNLELSRLPTDQDS